MKPKKTEGPTVEYLKKHGKQRTSIKWRDRKAVEIIKNFNGYEVGMIVKPHVTWAEELIDKKIAKPYVAPKKK